MIDECCAELEAAAAILKEREGQHGPPDVNLAKAARLWSAYKDTEMDAVDVAVMLGLLKVARVWTGKERTDSIRDLVGYGAIAAGLSLGR